MASKSDSDKQPTRNALPFEPNKSRKQSEKKQAAQKQAAQKQTARSEDKNLASQKVASQKPMKASSKQSGGRTATLAQSAIPDAVSKRMVKRMALYCGIPTALGMSTFIVSYLLVSQDLVKLPTIAVLLVSLGFFGLGVLGLSYGVLSTSWDEHRVGSWLGWSEFKTNFGRMTQAWRSSRDQS